MSMNSQKFMNSIFFYDSEFEYSWWILKKVHELEKKFMDLKISSTISK